MTIKFKSLEVWPELWTATQEILMPAQVQGAVLSHPAPSTAGLEALTWVHHLKIIYWHLDLLPKKESTCPHFQPANLSHSSR